MDVTAAVVTIHRPGEMSPRGRRRIAAWLRRTAETLVKDGDKLSPTRFTARYIYQSK